MGSVVKIRDVKGPNQNGWFSVIDGNDVEYTTKKQDLADKAKSLVGKNAEIEFSLKENGQYTNRYLDKIQPAASAPESSGGGGGGPSSHDIGRMARFSAMNTAAIICAATGDVSPKELVSVARWVLTYGFKGEEGLELEDEQPQPEPVNQPLVESDGIPF